MPICSSLAIKPRCHTVSKASGMSRAITKEDQPASRAICQDWDMRRSKSLSLSLSLSVALSLSLSLSLYHHILPILFLLFVSIIVLLLCFFFMTLLMILFFWFFFGFVLFLCSSDANLFELGYQAPVPYGVEGTSYV